MLVHDFNNARVVDEKDNHVFYTDNLTCGDDVVDEVVLLANTNPKEEWIYSEGVIDTYLLDADCTTEDKELICEAIHQYLQLNN